MSRSYRRRKEVWCPTGKDGYPDEDHAHHAAASLTRWRLAQGRPGHAYECSLCGLWHTTTHYDERKARRPKEIPSMNETEAREQGCTCFYSNVTVGRGTQARTWTQLETYNDTCPVAEHNEQATASAQATRAAEGQ